MIINRAISKDLRSGAFVRVLNESGYREALMGLSLSYKVLTPAQINGSVEIFENPHQFKKMAKIAETLAFKQGGHNKFLESIQVWLLVRGSLSFWKQFDTYRAGITKQSESTMHTLKKRELTIDDFTREVISFTHLKNIDDVDELRDNLPSGFLECRIVSTNYKTLQNIILQRRGHKSKKWGKFISQVINQVGHPELLRQGVQFL